MSISKKEDPRTIRTKEMLRNAVLSLLSEGASVSTLSVQKVAAQAGLNRTTFYLHYQDIQDLLTHITKDIVNEISNKIEALLHATELSEKQQLTQLLDYLYIHRGYLLTLLSISQFEEQLYLLLEQLIKMRRENTERDIPAEYVSMEIRTASLVGIIMWWIRKGLHYSSDYISEQIYLMYRHDS
jgi:AcrR family transcriptional regulator